MHSIVLAADGTIWTAGANSRGQVGADRSLWLWGQNRYGQVGDGTNRSAEAPVPVTGDGWVVAAGGADHTVAIRTDGSLGAWGYNGYGQLGTGGNQEHRTPVRVGADADWLGLTAGELGLGAATQRGRGSQPQPVVRWP